MRDKHLFAGVNSPKGFYSEFGSIMKEGSGRRKIFIKGGPGMGKSTLMKKIIKKANEASLPCEVFRCSSDPASVDGVYIPSLQTAIIDATAPHNADPALSLVSGEIFDVSKFSFGPIPSGKINDIISLTEAKKRSFHKGYRYLQAAVPLLKQIEAECLDKVNLKSVFLEAEKLAERLLGTRNGTGNGSIRRFFLSAISPEGFVNFSDTFFEDTYCVAIKGDYVASLFLGRFAELLYLYGLDAILFYCPMQPEEKIEHIYVPALGLSLTSYNFYTHSGFAESVELDEFISLPLGYGETYGLAATLMQRAIDAFLEAREAHGALEKIYIPNMNFEELERNGDQLIQSIF